ncbi:MAG: hypothetical protein ACR2RE_20145 [Geminicoccaceae bacterium]
MGASFSDNRAGPLLGQINSIVDDVATFQSDCILSAQASVKQHHERTPPNRLAAFEERIDLLPRPMPVGRGLVSHRHLNLLRWIPIAHIEIKRALEDEIDDFDSLNRFAW